MNGFTREDRLERAVRRVFAEGRLVRAWALKGGVSAEVTALEVALPDGTAKKLVVRCHGETDRERDPHVAAHEFKLLERLSSAGLPVPKPYDADETGEILPTPYVVIEFVEGETILSSASGTEPLLPLATTLADIHQVENSSFDVSFLPRQKDRLARLLESAGRSDSFGRKPVLHALRSAWPRLQRNGDALLHGDFWPGNALWKDGRLAAVIDWEDAALGDPLSDLANARLEIAWAFGTEAAAEFTRLYRSAMPALDYAKLPYWDLGASLRPAMSLSSWGLEPDKERDMRVKLDAFIEQALEKIDGLEP